MASSRKIERATYESVTFRALAADQHPDHDTIAASHSALGGLFVQVLQMCRRAGCATCCCGAMRKCARSGA